MGPQSTHCTTEVALTEVAMELLVGLLVPLERRRENSLPLN